MPNGERSLQDASQRVTAQLRAHTRRVRAGTRALLGVSIVGATAITIEFIMWSRTRQHTFLRDLSQAAIWTSVPALFVWQWAAGRRAERLFARIDRAHGVFGSTALRHGEDDVDPNARRAAQGALAQWLKGLSSFDLADTIPAHARTRLRHVLLDTTLDPTNDGDRAFVLAMIEALERMHDVGAVPHLDLLARTTGVTEVHDRARSALAVLRAEAERLGLQPTLLRPADPPASETLVRAASDASPEPDRLLRPSTPIVDEEEFKHVDAHGVQ